MSKFRPNNNNRDNGSQPQQRDPIAITGPSAMVQQMAQRNFAMKNGGQLPMQGNGVTPAVATVSPNMNFFEDGNRAQGKFQPMPTGKVPITDFADMERPHEFLPQGNGNVAPIVGPTQMPYMKDAAQGTPQPQSNFEGMQPNDGGVQWNPLKQNSDVGYKGAPYDPSKYDSLSAALNGGVSSQPQQPEFQADPSKKDGGFFSWIKGLIPKKRPGRREGETDDEYDARRTRNMEMVATFADAIRHIGNIVNTSKGAPLQQFNDPNSLLEAGYQSRKAQRQKQAALDADAAYKRANLSLKERAAEAGRAYKQLLLHYKDAADKRETDKFNYQMMKDAAADQYKRDKDKRDFEHKQDREKVKDKQTDRRLSISEYNATHKGSGRGGRSGKGGSGSGGKYWFEDKNGKMRYQPNKTMWEQEYYREYGKLPEGEASSSTSTKTIDKNGNEVTVTKRSKGTSMTAQAAASQNKAKAARNKSKPTQKTKNGYKNTKALGL